MSDESEPVEPPSEFLPGPRWRERMAAGPRWLAILVTFTVLLLIGLAIVAVVATVLGGLGASGVVGAAIWFGAVASLIPAIMRSPQPATASQDEAQPWTEYAVRAVMIGLDEPRPAAVRACTMVVFGPPLLGFGVVWVILSLAGIV